MNVYKVEVSVPVYFGRVENVIHFMPAESKDQLFSYLDDVYPNSDLPSIELAYVIGEKE